MNRGLFITFEGCDGCGKTTVMREVARLLKERGLSIFETREPGGSEIAEEIRGIILDKKNTKMDPRTEALLYAASRRQHLVESVLPALERGDIVLCDRYIDSSLAYQGYARGIGVDEVLTINTFAIADTFPDVTLFLDLTPEDCLRRISSNSEREVNRLDLEASSFHKRVYEGYRSLLERYPERMKAVDASRSVEEIADDCVRIIIEKKDEQREVLRS